EQANARALSIASVTLPLISISACVLTAAWRISSGLADRGFSAEVAITRSARGNRISAISPIALSRIAPNTRVMFRSSWQLDSVDRSAQAPAGLCATSSTKSNGKPEGTPPFDKLGADSNAVFVG